MAPAACHRGDLKGCEKSGLGDSDKTAPGDPIVVISNSLGLEASVTNGLISGIRGEGPRNPFQISAPISPCSSGGPVFDQQGSVTGVATATIQGAQNLNLAVPSPAIRSLLNNPKQVKLADLVPPDDDNRRSEAARLILQRVGTYLAKDMIEEAETQLRVEFSNMNSNPCSDWNSPNSSLEPGGPKREYSSSASLTSWLRMHGCPWHSSRTSI